MQSIPSHPFREIDVSYNSLISRNMLGWSWLWDQAVHPYPFHTDDRGLVRAVRINMLGGSPNPGRGKTCFVIPPGCPGGEFSVEAYNPSGPNALRLSIYDDALSSAIYQQNIPVDTTRRRIRLPALLPQGQYWATIDVNSGAPVSQCQPVLMDPLFEYYRSSSGILSGGTMRVEMTPSMLRGNYYHNGVGGRYFRQNIRSDFETMAKNGTRYAVESWVQGPGSSNNHVTQLINGRPAAAGTTFSDLVMGWDEFPIPTTERIRVGARGGLQAEWLITSTYLQALRGFYFEDDAELSNVIRQYSRRSIVLVGDSLMCGVNAANTQTQGWGDGLALVYPGEMYMEAAGNRSFNSVMKDAATQDVYIERIGRPQPTDCLIQMGINDVIVNLGMTWGQPELENALTSFITKFKARLPNCNLTLTTAFIRGTEGTVGPQGTTIIQVRASTTTVATAQSVPLFSGIAANMPSATYLDPDNIHLKTDGQCIAAYGHKTNLGF